MIYVSPLFNQPNSIGRLIGTNKHELREFLIAGLGIRENRIWLVDGVPTATLMPNERSRAIIVGRSEKWVQTVRVCTDRKFKQQTVRLQEAAKGNDRL